MIFFVLIITWIASAFFCSTVASEKGYSSISWFIAGFFFGFFALIAVAGLPDKRSRKYLRQIAENPPKDQSNKKFIDFDYKEEDTDRLRKLDEDYMDNMEN